MSKFKVGDEVVLVEFEGIAEDFSLQIGDVGVVIQENDNSRDYQSKVKFLNAITVCKDKELELLSVYNSPLYKALL